MNNMTKYEANSPVCAGPRSCTAPWAAACRWALARGAARGWSQCRRSARARCRTTPAAPTPARTPSCCGTAPPPAYRHRDQTQSQSSYHIKVKVELPGQSHSCCHRKASWAASCRRSEAESSPWRRRPGRRWCGSPSRTSPEEVRCSASKQCCFTLNCNCCLCKVNN